MNKLHITNKTIQAIERFSVKKTASFILLLSLGATGSFAQQHKIPEPVWTHSLSTKDFKVGDVIEIVLKSDFSKDYHIYSNDFSDDCPPQKAELTFNNNDGSYEVVGGMVPVGAEKEEDDIFQCEISWFHGHAELRQKVKILKPNAHIEAELFYQVCATEMCVNFEYNFTMNLQAVAKTEGSKTDNVLDAEGKTNRELSYEKGYELKQPLSQVGFRHINAIRSKILSLRTSK